ncbi:MAG: sigma-E processing peptidase SpoIIGA, partial [Eubacteriales bacterium]|nr:sigma-E processing peptidase SpoIIGA [Eubacteriales bacterium]
MNEEVFIIYADILILINFVLDFICLFISGKLLSKRSGLLRMFFASLFGAGYSLVYYLLYPIDWFYMLPLHIIAAFIICKISFRLLTFKEAAKTVVIYILSSALLGGILNAVYGITGRFSDGIYTEISAPSLIIISVLSTLVALAYSLLCKKRVTAKSMHADIYLDTEPISVNLLVDSGNMATEPFSSLPVIILCSQIMPPPLNEP